MPRKPEQQKTWTVYKVAAKAILLGTVEAPDKKAAIEAGAKEFKTDDGACTRCRCDEAERGKGTALLPPRQQRTIDHRHILLVNSSPRSTFDAGFFYFQVSQQGTMRPFNATAGREALEDSGESFR
jgi:hypothetical protein